MPKVRKESSDSSDSGPEDRNPPPSKKAKPAKSASSSASNDDSEYSWVLDKNRTVKVREFRGKVYVDIREYYEADGELKPSKKGISLTGVQFHKLKDLMPEIEKTLKKM